MSLKPNSAAELVLTPPEVHTFTWNAPAAGMVTASVNPGMAV